MNKKLAILIVVILVVVAIGTDIIIHRISSFSQITYEKPTTVEQCEEGIKDFEAAIKDLKEQRKALLFEEDKKTCISVWALLKARQEIYNGPYRKYEGEITITGTGDTVCVQNLLKIIDKAQELETAEKTDGKQL